MAWLTFQPKLFQALKGYNGHKLGQDIGAGLTVGVVALPLAMAFVEIGRASCRERVCLYV